MKKIDFGKFKVIIEKAYISKALNAILISSLVYDKIEFGKNEELILTAHASLKEKYRSVFSENGIVAVFTENTGILTVFQRYSKRWGLFLGIILLFILVHLSSKIVWKINIEGNYTVTDSEIEAILNDSGLYLGAFIPDINYDRLHNRFLMSTDKISWISVNIDGNVANVVVNERLKAEEPEEKSYTNVIAASDGQIALVTVYDGIKTVNISDVVKKGDILISGVMDSSSQGVRYVHADGIVKAYVKKNISVKIPMKQEIKVYTGNTYTDRDIKIFTKYINILKKYRNSYLLCDRIETKENLTLFGSCTLPITVRNTRYFEYGYESITYTQKEAKDLAMAELKIKMDSALSDAELISKRVNHYCDFEYYYVECELYCIEDIAELVEFKVTEE